MAALRALIALLAGMALGALLVLVVLFTTTRGAQRPAPANGDPNLPYDVSLTLTERFVQDQLANPTTTSGQSGTVTLREPQVRLRPDGTLQVSGKLSTYGLLVPARVVLLPRIVDGQLALALEEGQLGGFTIPNALVQQIQDQLNQRLRDTMAQQPFRVVALLPGDGTLGVHLQATRAGQ